jgi:NAD(P)-dependent dehydrogenase (short-subunit alcohol dehydrogenase family)
MTHRAALIVGAGLGLSAELARRLAADGFKVALAARTLEKLRAIESATGARAFACDATDATSVDRLFAEVAAAFGDPDVVVYNASGRLRGPLIALDAAAVQSALAVTAFGGFLVGQAAARRMLARGSGTILFTGASASVKGYAQSAPFAMGKFALRGLAQSMARELAPLGVHVAHIIIDGAIRPSGHEADPSHPDSMLEPGAIAETYLYLIGQPRSAWTWEVEVRPWVERF